MKAGRTLPVERGSATIPGGSESADPFPMRPNRGQDEPNVLVLCSHPPLARGVLFCLDGMGARVHVVGAEAWTPLRFSRYCHKYTRNEFPETEAERSGFAEFVNDYVQARGIGVIVPDTVETAGLLSSIGNDVCGATCFPVSPKALLDTLLDKWTFAEFLRRNGIYGAPAVLIASERDRDPERFVDLDFPRMVKPLARDGGGGVVKVESHEEIRAHIRGRAPFNDLPLIAQKFIPGLDLDPNVLAIEGEIVAWTVDTRPEGGGLEFTENPDVVEVGRKIIGAAKYHSIANFDMCIDASSGAVTVLKCNPRPWYTIAASLWQGTNFIRLGIDWSMRRPLPKQNTHSTGRYFSHSDIMTNRVLRRSAFKEVPRANLQGLRQQVLDPVPLFFQNITKISWKLGV